MDISYHTAYLLSMVYQINRLSACRTLRFAAIYDLLKVSQKYGSDHSFPEKICTAFDITLSQLFAEEDAPVFLTEAQKKLLDRWARLSEEQQAVVFALIDKM